MLTQFSILPKLLPNAMRSLDLLLPENQKAIAQLFLNQAIAELPSDTRPQEIIDKAMKLGKHFELIISDFEGITGK
jgi:hypothetical protein